MRSSSATAPADSHRALLVIGGLSVLAAAMCCPAVPAVTAMAMVAWGATSITVARFRGVTALPTVVAAHLAIYGGLYALFVGAAMHRAAGTPGGLGLVAAIDLAVSVGPMVAAARSAIEVLTSLRTTG